MKPLFFIFLFLPAMLSATDWPTLHKDLQRSAYTSEMVEGPYERKWFANLEDEMIPIRAEVIIGDGRCYIGTMLGGVHAWDAKTGEKVWTKKVPGAVGHSPAFSNGNLYVLSDDSLWQGTLSCFDAKTGDLKWEFRSKFGAYTHPATDGKRVFFGDRGGMFYAVDAKSGKEIWSHDTGGIVLQPASITEDSTKVLVANEEMFAFCFNASSGKVEWKSDKMGGVSFRDHAPAIWNNELVFFMSNPAAPYHDSFGMRGKYWKDCHLDYTLNELMTPEQKKEYEEAINSFEETNKGIWRLKGEEKKKRQQEANAFKEKAEKILNEAHEKSGDEILKDAYGVFIMKWTEERQKIELKFIREYLDKHREEEVFYAFRLKDGSVPWKAPVTFCAGMHANPAYPTWNPEAKEPIYLWSGTALSNYAWGVPGGALAVVTLDPKTGLTKTVWHNESFDSGMKMFGQPNDESQSLSLMGDILLNTHQGSIFGMNLKTLKWHPVVLERDSYGGIYGVRYNKTTRPLQGFYTQTQIRHNEGYLVAAANGWHGPDAPCVSIAEGRIYWQAGSQVVCIGGPDAEKMASGGPSPAPDIKRKRDPLVPACNVAVAFTGEYDESIQRKKLTAEHLNKLLKNFPAIDPKLSSAEKAEKVRQLLIEEINELISKDWAPFVYELGISGEDTRFYRSDEAMQIVALSLPHLPEETKKKAIAWLDKLYDQGYPLKEARFERMKGERREPFDIGKKMRENNYKIQPDVEVLYAVWAYANYADRWDKVMKDKKRLDDLANQYISKPFKFDHHGKTVDPKTMRQSWKNNDDTERLNAQISGLTGYIRILQHENEDVPQKAKDRLLEMLETRVHHERADDCYVRGYDATELDSHSAAIPRYLRLTPSLAKIMAEEADIFRKNLPEILLQIPTWYHAYAEHLMGGENFITPAHVGQSLFIALADGIREDGETLVKYLDHPWSKADLYYIEKCTAVLRAFDNARP